MTKCICVWYWFIFLPYVSPFLRKKIVEGNDNVSKKHHVIQEETVQSDTVGYYPRSALCCLGIYIQVNSLDDISMVCLDRGAFCKFVRLY